MGDATLQPLEGRSQPRHCLGLPTHQVDDRARRNRCPPVRRGEHRAGAHLSHYHGPVPAPTTAAAIDGQRAARHTGQRGQPPELVRSRTWGGGQQQGATAKRQVATRGLTAEQR